MLSIAKSMSRSDAGRLLDLLGVLRAVVESGSFVGAGEALGLTQPAVSRTIARLEARIGVRIFLRTARSISLTDEGRRFYESVAPHLSAIEEATVEAGDSKAKVRGRLRVNVDSGVGQHILTSRLGPFFDKYPDVFVELGVRDRMGDLVRDGFDVAIRFGPPELSSLKTRLLLRTRVITCASPSYVTRHGAPRTPREVENHRCLLMRDPRSGTAFGWDFVRGKKTITVNVKGALMVNGGGLMLESCIAGQGIAQLFEIHARELIREGRLVQLLPEWSDETYPLYAYHHEAKLMSAKVRAFLDFVVTALRNAGS